MPQRVGRLLVLLAAIGWAAMPLAAGSRRTEARGAVPSALTMPPTAPVVLRLLATLDPQAHVLAAVETDIDSDADLDLVAATDESLDAWLNDGTGHFTRDTLRPPAVLRALPGVGDTTPSSIGPALGGQAAKNVALAARSGVSRQAAFSLCPPVLGPVGRPRSYHDAGSGRAPPRGSVLN
jgi:hypothetical protein